jgi:hypothetical protein
MLRGFRIREHVDPVLTDRGDGPRRHVAAVLRPGFSALLLALRPAAGARLSLLDRPCKNSHDVHFRIDGGSAAAGAICAVRHSGDVDLAKRNTGPEVGSKPARADIARITRNPP